MLLSINVIPDINSTSILQQPEEHIDSSEYASWEQFFTRFLTDKTKENPVWCYSKKKLVKAYLSAKVFNAAKRFMKFIIWD